MKCPVCQKDCLENSHFCNVCAWEFTVYVSDISEQEQKLYCQKLQIAQKNWNELNKLKSKAKTKEKKNKTKSNAKKTKTVIKSDDTSNVKKTTDLIYSDKTAVLHIDHDPFETFEEFQSRIINYPPFPAGKAKLIKKDYSFQVGEFPLEVEWNELSENIELTKNYDFLEKQTLKKEKLCLHVPPNIAKLIFDNNQFYTLFIKLKFAYEYDKPILDSIKIFWNNQTFPVTRYNGVMKPFVNESQKDYKNRITSYNDIIVGECSLIKQKYDIETEKFPLRLKIYQWVNDIHNSKVYFPYIVLNRKMARNLYEKSKIYPLKASFSIKSNRDKYNYKFYYPSIDKYYIDLDNNKFSIKDIISTVHTINTIDNVYNCRVINRTVIEPITQMELIYVPEGSFLMGDIFDNGLENEKPIHEVKIDGFYISKYPVTQGQWKSIMNKNPSNFKKFYKNTNNYPIENISHNDAQSFIKKINELNISKFIFRLPTEAEWEYAARSCGKKELYAGTDSIDSFVWYNGNSKGTTHPVGKKEPNGVGLFDMSGNVWEWCEDNYSKAAYSKHTLENPVYLKNTSISMSWVMRGGSWKSNSSQCRVAYRRQGRNYDTGGFRLVWSPWSNNLKKTIKV